MKLQALMILGGLMVALTFVGCGQPAATTSNDNGGEAAGEEEHGHEHGEDDALFWQREGIEHKGHVIALGHHGIHPHAGEELEPAVMITKDGEPVADAQMFVTLLDGAGENVLTEEQATVYEPQTPDEPAHYAQGMVMVPADAEMVQIRYRIELPAASEFSQDVAVEVVKH